MHPFGVAEALRAATQQEPRPEHLRVERRCDVFGIASLNVTAHRSEFRRAPANGTEVVERIGGVAQVTLDSGSIGLGAVGDDDLHATAQRLPWGAKKLFRAAAVEWRSIMSHNAAVAVDDHRHSDGDSTESMAHHGFPGLGICQSSIQQGLNLIPRIPSYTPNHVLADHPNRLAIMLCSCATLGNSEGEESWQMQKALDRGSSAKDWRTT